MTTATQTFFDRLSQVSHDPRLANARGTLRFDLSDGADTHHWNVAVLHGDIVVSDDDAPADGVLTGPRELFDQIVRGDTNAMAAILRGALTYEGDPKVAVLFRRLFGTPELSAS